MNYLTKTIRYYLKRNMAHANLFYIFSTLCIACFFVVTYKTSSHFINTDFRGFLVSENLLISEFHLPSWKNNPLPAHRLIYLNNQPVHSRAELYALEKSFGEGQKIKYTFESINGNRFSDDFEIKKFSSNEYLLTYGIIAYSAVFILLSMLIGIPLAPKHWRFPMWLYGSSAAIWLIGTFDYYTYSLFSVLTLVFGACLIPSAFHFNLVLCEERRIPKFLKMLVLTSYLVSILLSGSFLIVYDQPSRISQLLYIVPWINGGFWTMAIIVYLLKKLNEKTPFDHARQRTLLLLVSQTVFYGLPLFILMAGYIFEFRARLNQFLFALSLFPITVLYLCYSERMAGRIRKFEKMKDVGDRFISLGILSGGLAHEINNPLQILSLHTHALKLNLGKYIDTKDHTYQEKVKGSADKILKSLDRIYRVVESMDAFSKGKLKVMPDVDVKSIVTTCADEAKEKSVASGKRINFDLSLLQDDKIIAAPGLLTQVLANIVFNSVDAIQNEGFIQIKSKLNSKFLKITIMDSGPGISEEVKNRIFEPFFTTKEPGEGMGLGLWIASQLMAAQGGKIIASSPINGGTMFEIIYPQGDFASVVEQHTRLKEGVSHHF